MNLTTKLTRSPNATFEVVADEAILIHLKSGVYFSLNKIGTEYWEMLDGTASIAEHALTIATKYEVDTALVEKDLLALSVSMAADDLVDAE